MSRAKVLTIFKKKMNSKAYMSSYFAQRLMIFDWNKNLGLGILLPRPKSDLACSDSLPWPASPTSIARAPLTTLGNDSHSTAITNNSEEVIDQRERERENLSFHISYSKSILSRTQLMLSENRHHHSSHHLWAISHTQSSPRAPTPTCKCQISNSRRHEMHTSASLMT